jgi:asparagine synthase (glutamine-hydrolysing)
MSTVIGYWSGDDNNETPDKLHRLLTKAVADANRGESKISPPCSGQSPPRPDGTGHTRPINFGIAVCGRQATLEVAGARAPGGATHASLTAGLAVSGAGMTADAWFKVSGGGLILGREVFGRATIFWTRTDDAVWFASQLGLLLSVVGNAQVSVAGFYAYGCYSYVPAPLTPVKNIFAIPAGSETVWSGVAPEAPPQNHTLYEWREAAAQTIDEKEAAGSLRKLLEESVSTQLGRAPGGEPVGVFLSGGLDSSVTAAMLVRAGARVRAYTLDFGRECFSEVPYAELVAGALGIPLTKIPVNANSVRRTTASTAARLDGLYGDGVTIPLALLCEYARKEVRVVFNGEGGDQLFAGWTNKPLIAASLYESHADATRASATAAGEELFAARYMRTFHRLHGHEAGVYTRAVRREIEELDALAPLARALDPAYTRELLHCLRRANLMLKGADNIQPRAASLGLSYGLDVRTLFCSRPLAEWTFGVGGELWLRAGCEKYLLKRAAEDLLPSAVVWREKRGMGVPLTVWLTGRLRRWAKKQLHPRVLAREGLWQPDAARRILEGELSGQLQGRRIGETLWLMIMWRAWCEGVLQPTAEPARDSSVSTRPWLPLHSVRALKRRFT